MFAASKTIQYDLWQRFLSICTVCLALGGCTSIQTTPEMVEPSAAAAVATIRLAEKPTATRIQYTPSAPVETRTPRVDPALTPRPSATVEIRAVCPVADPSLRWDEKKFSGLDDFFNSGGMYENLTQADREDFPPDVYQQDLTGDGVPEITIAWYHLIIYRCQNGKYVSYINESSPYPWIIDRIQDFNKNGLAEVVGISGGPHGDDLTIYEWDGNTFTVRFDITEGPVYLGVGLLRGEEFARARASVGIDYLDIDQDGKIEIILTTKESGDPDTYINGPYQLDKTIYRWDGKEYALYQKTYDPVYRFEAVQDGELSLWKGE